MIKKRWFKYSNCGCWYCEEIIKAGWHYIYKGRFVCGKKCFKYVMLEKLDGS